MYFIRDSLCNMAGTPVRNVAFTVVGAKVVFTIIRVVRRCSNKVFWTNKCIARCSYEYIAVCH